MSKEVKIRFVRCPRCGALLPELQEHPVYICGSCKTVLQAKSRRAGCLDSETETPLPTATEGIRISDGEGPSSTSTDIARYESLNRKGKSKLVQDDEANEDQVTALPPEGTVNPSENDETSRSCFTHSPCDDAPSFRINGWLDTSMSTAFSTELELNPKSMSKSPETSGSCYNSIEYCYDGIDDHKLMKDKDSSIEDWRNSRMNRSSRGDDMAEFRFRDVSGLPGDDPLAGNSRFHGFTSSDKLTQLDLLRKFQELEEQISRMHLSEIQGAAQARRRFPVQDCLWAPERENYADHHALYRNPGSSSSSQCYSQDINMASQLHLRFKNRHHVFQSNHISRDFSRSMSSQHGTRRNQSNEGNPENVKTTSKTVKRHLLPVASGSPLVACHHCCKLLQLPSELMTFKGRYQKLMCGACKKILTISFKDRYSTSFMQSSHPRFCR